MAEIRFKKPDGGEVIIAGGDPGRVRKQAQAEASRLSLGAVPAVTAGGATPQPQLIAPTPTTVPTQPTTHKVVEGDSLSKIALANNISLNELIEINPQFGTGGGRNPNLIFPNEKIRLPAKLGVTPSPEDASVVDSELAAASMGGATGLVPSSQGQQLVGNLQQGIEDFFGNLKDVAGEPPERQNLVEQFQKFRNDFGLVNAEEELQTAQTNLTVLEDSILGEAEKIKGEKVSSVV